MKKTVSAYLQRSLMLLELARTRADQTRIRWCSEDLGPWASVKPRWSALGGRIRFQFHFQGRLRTCWAAAVRQRPWGIIVSLSNSKTSPTEPFEMLWEDPVPGHSEPRRLWKVATQWLALRFPGHRIIRAVRRSDLARTLSRSFLRLLFSHAGSNHLLIAASDSAGDEIHLAMGQALLWMASLISTRQPMSISALHILVPSGASAVLFHRCSFLNKDRIKAELWEYGGNDPQGPEFHRASAPSPPEEDRDFRWPVLGPFRWSSPLQRVLELAPELIRRYPRFRDYDSLRLWGLEFAQVTGLDRDRVLFGVGAQRTELSEDNFELLRSLVEEIIYYRRPECPDTRHPFYRLQAERWLEALVLESVPHLFPELAPESVYSQIPVYLGKESGRIDILGADRQGTLVVMELKVAPDADLPIQALDYWGRVIQHNQNGDFGRRGYFSEVQLNRRHPRIYLISPIFSFHDTTECLLRYLEPDLEVWKISINEDWRWGVKIIRRIQYRCKDLMRTADGN